MKKILAILLLTGTLSLAGFSQLPTGDITIENPRIIGSTFYWDVYFMRTNDDGQWYSFGVATLGNSSWYFNFNLTDLTNYQIVYEDPTLFPVGGNYTNTIGPNGGFLEINTLYTPLVAGTHILEDVWYLAFTCSADITGTATNLSGLSWDAVNTGLTSGQNISVWPIGYFDSNCDIVLNHKCWDGSSNGDWDNANNWSPTGVPSGVDIIYPNNPTNELTGLSISTFGSVQNLRVNHLAEMTIPQSTGLTVTSNVTLKGGPRNIVCAAGNNVGTLSSAFIPEGTIDYNGYVLETGHIEVHRTIYYTATSAEFYMHQVAAPVDGVILDDWDMIHENTYAYEFNTDLQDWWNIYVPSRLTPPGYGFVLSLWEIGAASTEDIVFYDNLVLTNVTPTFTIASGENALLGNPYTAPIDWESMMPQASISNTVYVWDPGAGTYRTYTAGSGGNNSARYIQPGQSYFIEATGAATQVIMTTADRTQNIHPYLKDEFSNLLRIYTEGGNETYDETYIRFMEGENVTAAYDVDHDGHKYPSAYEEFATEINTVSSDSVNLAVDARPMIEGEQVSIPLHFKPTIEAEYKILADEESITTFDESIKILLEDTFMPELDWIDLRAEGYYTFDATMDDEYDRFILHFHDTDFGIEDGLAYKPIKIYSDRTDAFIINDSEQLIKEIHVYDITGNLMTSKSTVNDAVTRMYVSDRTGYYVVKVITDKAVYSEKVLITK